MSNLTPSKNGKQHRVSREFVDKIWTILMILGLVSVIGYGVVIQILHHP